MKTILLSLTAAAALAAAAAPAAAQDWRGQSAYGQSYGQRYDQGRGYDQRYDQRYNQGRGYDAGRLTTSYVDSLAWKITKGERNGTISRRDAQQLSNELRQVQTIAWKIQTGRASRWESDRLERTVSRIEAAVNRYAGNDRYDRDDRHDWRR